MLPCSVRSYRAFTVHAFSTHSLMLLVVTKPKSSLAIDNPCIPRIFNATKAWPWMKKFRGPAKLDYGVPGHSLRVIKENNSLLIIKIKETTKELSA
jgi:hypothetical protein